MKYLFYLKNSSRTFLIKKIIFVRTRTIFGTAHLIFNSLKYVIVSFHENSTSLETIFRGGGRYKKMEGPPCLRVTQLESTRSKLDYFMNSHGKKWGEPLALRPPQFRRPWIFHFILRFPVYLLMVHVWNFRKSNQNCRVFFENVLPSEYTDFTGSCNLSIQKAKFVLQSQKMLGSFHLLSYLSDSIIVIFHSLLNFRLQFCTYRVGGAWGTIGATSNLRIFEERAGGFSGISKNVR